MSNVQPLVLIGRNEYMKYVYLGIGLIILAIISFIFNIFYAKDIILKMVVAGLNIFTIIMGIRVIKGGFKIIKLEKEMELLKMWPQSN